MVSNIEYCKFYDILALLLEIWAYSLRNMDCDMFHLDHFYIVIRNMTGIQRVSHVNRQ